MSIVNRILSGKCNKLDMTTGKHLPPSVFLHTPLRKARSVQKALFLRKSAFFILKITTIKNLTNAPPNVTI